MITTKDLSRLVSSISLAVAKRSPVDWHSRMLVEREGGRLLLAASSSNGVAWLSMLDDGEPFRVAVRATDLQQLVSACRSSSLKIELKGSKLKFSGEHGELSLAYAETLPKLVGGWPSLPNLPETACVAVMAGDLRFALQCASQGMGAVEDEYFSLDSLLLTSEGETLTVTSTDGRKAVRVPVACDAVGEPLAVQVASVSVRLFIAFISQLPEDTRLMIGTEAGDVVVWSHSSAVFLRRPAKTLPKMAGVWTIVDHAAAAEFSIDSSVLIAALRESTIGYGKEEDRAIVLSVSADGVAVGSKPDCDNQLESRIEVSVDGREVVCVFDAQFIASLLRCTPTAQVRLIDVSNKNIQGYTAVIVGERGYQAIVSGMHVTREHIQRGERMRKPELATS